MSSNRLSELLSECSVLLKSVGEEWWSAEMDRILACSDPVLSAQKVLDLYGGMGSFSDLMLCAINGHNVAPENEDKINTQLSNFRSKIYEEAERLVRG